MNFIITLWSGHRITLSFRRWQTQFKYERPDVPNDQMHHAWPFDKPYFLIMNTAVGGGLGGPVDDSQLPYVFEIEYVHVYQKK